MNYALQTLLHERSRYAAGVGAVLFSAVLIALQVGLLLGLFELTSIPVDHSNADLWIGGKSVESVDLGRPIPVSFIGRLNKPGLKMPELYYLNFGNFTKPSGGYSLCTVIGTGLSADTAGCPDVLSAAQRQLLTETMTVAVDASDLGKLGLTGIGDRAKVNGKEVRVVAVVKGIKSLAAPGSCVPRQPPATC